MNQRTLTVTWEDPVAASKESTHLSGLEFLEAMRNGTVPPPPIARLLGFELVEFGEGFAAFECTPGEQHYNTIGRVHGGTACTLLDAAMGCAVNTTLAPGLASTTLEIKVNLVRAVRMQTGKLRAEGRLLHGGRRIATAEGKLIDASGRLYAHGTTTCMIIPIGEG